MINEELYASMRRLLARPMSEDLKDLFASRRPVERATVLNNLIYLDLEYFGRPGEPQPDETAFYDKRFPDTDIVRDAVLHGCDKLENLSDFLNEVSRVEAGNDKVSTEEIKRCVNEGDVTDELRKSLDVIVSIYNYNEPGHYEARRWTNDRHYNHIHNYDLELDCVHEAWCDQWSDALGAFTLPTELADKFIRMSRVSVVSIVLNSRLTTFDDQIHTEPDIIKMTETKWNERQTYIEKRRNDPAIKAIIEDFNLAKKGKQ